MAIAPLAPYPATRLRRLRQADWTRRMVRETVLTPNDLIWSMVVHDGNEARIPVASMPGMERLSVKEAAKAAVNVKQMLPLSVIVHADAGPNHTAQLPEEYRHEVRFSWSIDMSDVKDPRSLLNEKLVKPLVKEYYRQDKSTSSRIPVDRILLFVNGAPVPYDNEHFRAGEFQRAFGAVLGAAEVELRVLMTSDDL